MSRRDRCWVLHGDHARAFGRARSDGFTIVRFIHEGWAEPVEFLSQCSTKWAVFLVGLKALIETGTGSPSLHDVPISDWH